MTVFGDDDPEDGWDETDPLDVKIKILARLLASVALEADGEHNPDRVAIRLAFGEAATVRTRVGHGPPDVLDAVLVALLIGFLMLRAELGL